MTAGCARCGSCCQSIYLSGRVNVAKWTTAALEGVPDPATDEGWAFWSSHGWDSEGQSRAVSIYNPDGKVRQDADFIAAHWKRADGDSDGEDERYDCDAYDQVTGLCTAHDDRPPVCRDYPWYEGDPDADRARHMNLECSYLADLPPSDRPENARPLIPLTVL